MGGGRQFSVREATGKTSNQETEMNLEETWDKESKSPAGMAAKLRNQPYRLANKQSNCNWPPGERQDRERETALIITRVFDLSKLRTR